MDWQERYADRRRTADEAVLSIAQGAHVFIGGGASQPVGLVEALGRQAEHFVDTTIVHLMTLGPAPYVGPEYADHFRHNAFFIGANVREAIHAGRGDYTPVFLSQIPALVRSRRLPVDAALIQCSPPDRFGFVNLGVSVDIIPAALDAARLVIAEINPNVPVVHGGGFVSMERVHLWTWSEEPLIEAPPEPLDEAALEIGRNVAGLIGDGCTLQTGIGQIPDATLRALRERRDLGLWTEMFSDGVMELIECGAITGRHKPVHPGKVTSSFAFGSSRLYRFLDRHPAFTFQASDLVNDPVMIARQHRMVAINSALQVDVTGQVCADSIGTRFYSGIGGQVDFIRGASMCPGGVPIIALRATARGGSVSRIAATLTEGAGVVTSRGDVRYVVTEYGVADLLGKSIRDRAVALISIAHPDFRGELLAAARQRHYVFTDQLEPRGRYPREVERRVRDAEGRELLLRPIRPTDEDKLSQLFYALTADSLQRRFLRAVRRVSHGERRSMLDVDYVTDLAIVLETCPSGAESELVGIGQYFLDARSSEAEVAFVVRDDWQGRGLGTLLAQELVRLARQRGVRGFVADVLVGNLPMLHVFQKTGLSIHSTLENGVYHLTMPFEPLAPLPATGPAAPAPG